MGLRLRIQIDNLALRRNLLNVHDVRHVYELLLKDLDNFTEKMIFLLIFQFTKLYLKLDPKIWQNYNRRGVHRDNQIQLELHTKQQGT